MKRKPNNPNLSRIEILKHSIAELASKQITGGTTATTGSSTDPSINTKKKAVGYHQAN